jgi:hypothetical protein
VPRVASRALHWLVLLLIPLLAGGQGRSSDGWEQVPYNGAFTFTRIRYGGGGFRRGGGSWAHDYPRADQHLPKIIEYVSTIPINLDASNVYDLDDPEVFRHPIIYLSEPGFWTITDTEAESLRKYLLKGGFLILDDFEGNQWYNMEAQLRHAMPDHQLIEIGPDLPVFSSLFELKDIYVPHAMYGTRPTYYALFENNDPAQRMLVLVNHDSDLAEYWEWAGDESFVPIPMSNEAFKLGVNYILYALTH